MRVKNYSTNMIYLLIMFGVIGTRFSASAQLSNIDTLKKFAADSYDIMENIYETHSESPPSAAVIIGKFEDVIASIGEWDTGLEERVQAINTMIAVLPFEEGENYLDVDNVTQAIEWIHELYVEFRGYVENPSSLSENTAGELQDFYISRNGDDLIAAVRDIFSTISPDEWGNYKNSPLYLVALRTHEKLAIEHCDLGNPQQHLLDYYSLIVISEMRAIAMTGFSYLMKDFKGNVSYIGEMKKAGEEFVARAEKYLLILRKVLPKVEARGFRTCDPPEGNKRDETFYEFERFIQVAIFDEEVLTNRGLCDSTCGELGEHSGLESCDWNSCRNGVPKCQGNIKRCATLNWKADFCEYDDDAPRRYKWIKDGWGTHHPYLYGCSDGKFNWINWHKEVIYNCDICRCLCVEETPASPSKHFISLREQLSDVADNMVIVGLRFRMVNKILHIDIQHAPVGDNGMVIDGDKVEWKAIEDIQYDREKSIKSKRFKFYKNNENGEREELIQNKDVAVLGWNSRRIDLDRLTSPSSHFITGVKFARDLKRSGLPIHLEIQATPFDYGSGQLDAEKSIWIGPQHTSYGLKKYRRTEYEGEGFDNPELSGKTAIDTKPNMFIDVDWSSWNLDASQTVIPFLDARAVSADPPIGLSGVGLYHRKQKGYGGFLSFVLEGVDIAPFIENPRR